MIVIVQPWFSAFGHPAQSLINLANIIGNQKGIIYLISAMSGNEPVEKARSKLKFLGNAVDYSVKTPSIREGTLKALRSLRKLFATNSTINRVFFLDAHLVLLAALWSFYAQKKIKRLGVVYLMGPERVTRYGVVKHLIGRFLKRKEVVLFLRTEELVADWKIAFPEASIKCLPPLEMPFDQELAVEEHLPSTTIRLGVLGQIRTGKSLEWLVPLFKGNPSLGKLTVAGAFSQPEERKRLAVLEKFEGFQDKFLSEEELLILASRQDYLLMLYDNWDHRMEGAVMFLAARVNRPVIVYDKGWCGRMVKTYGNGLFAPQDNKHFTTFVKSLPQYGSDEYQKLLEGVNAFRQAHSGNSMRIAFLDAIKA
jgi:glycosyltransferase involved in cell wall biosynthesis